MKYVEKPFFSIIIPCYNSKKTIKRLLNSILRQNMAEEIQVILSDDHSTESYEDEISFFYDKLCIEKIETDYNCCPGNTREKGTTIARGTWIVFADHDDVFIPNTFRKIKKQILDNKEEYIAYCNIHRSVNTDGEFNEKLAHRTMTSFTTLLHGKFFNRENLWNEYDIHFKQDMFTHEDTYVINVTKCILEYLHHDPLHIDLVDYVWFNNSKSLSNSTGIRNFLEEHFHYYIEGSSWVFREYYNRGIISKEYAEYRLIELLLYQYFYMQMFIFTNPETFMQHNATLCRDELLAVKRMFKLTNTDIFWYAGSDHAKLYASVAKEAGYGFIPNHSLIEWFNILNKDT